MSREVLKRLTVVLHCLAAAAAVGLLIYLGTTVESPEGSVASGILPLTLFFFFVSVIFAWEPLKLAGVIVRLVNLLWMDLIAVIAVNANLLMPDTEWNIGRIALLMFGPPAALYVLYRSFYWVVKGQW